MGNKNYQRGYQAEYKVMKEFQGQVWGIRSPASKGMFDVTGISYDGVYLIQVKRTKKKKVTPSMYADEIQSIQDWVKGLKKHPKWLKVQLWVWIDRQGWLKYNITKGKVEIINEH